MDEGDPEREDVTAPALSSSLELELTDTGEVWPCPCVRPTRATAMTSPGGVRLPADEGLPAGEGVGGSTTSGEELAILLAWLDAGDRLRNEQITVNDCGE